MNTRKYNISLSALDRAVVAQLGGTCSELDGGRMSFGQDARELVAGAPDFCYGWRD